MALVGDASSLTSGFHAVPNSADLLNDSEQCSVGVSQPALTMNLVCTRPLPNADVGGSTNNNIPAVDHGSVLSFNELHNVLLHDSEAALALTARYSDMLAILANVYSTNRFMMPVAQEPSAVHNKQTGGITTEEEQAKERSEGGAAPDNFCIRYGSSIAIPPTDDTGVPELPYRYDKSCLLTVLRNLPGVKTRAAVKALLQPGPDARIFASETKKYSNQERLANDTASARFRRQYLCVMEELIRTRIPVKRTAGLFTGEKASEEPSPITIQQSKRAGVPYVRDLRALQHPEIKQKKKPSLSVAATHSSRALPTSSVPEKKHGPPLADTSLSWRSQKTLPESKEPMRATRAYSEKWKCVVSTRENNDGLHTGESSTTIVSRTLSAGL